jgi:hypothetical protein
VVALKAEKGEKMRFIPGAAKFAVAAASLAVLLLAAPAGAVVGGTSDTDNSYANVGVLQLNVDGEWSDFCSGTLVRPDVVLTAAHCTDFLVEEGSDGFGPDDLRISFDPQGDAPYYSVDHIVVHPDWFTAGPCFGNSKHACLAPPAEDIALVFLDETVDGVTPAPIAEEGYLDTLDLKSETFTVVGYGTDAFITGSAASPKAITVFDGVRSYRDVSSIAAQDAFPDRFLKITAGVVLRRFRRPTVRRRHHRCAQYVDIQLPLLRAKPGVSPRLGSRSGVSGHLSVRKDVPARADLDSARAGGSDRLRDDGAEDSWSGGGRMSLAGFSLVSRHGGLDRDASVDSPD